MKINPTLIKSVLAMAGLSMEDIQAKATPAIAAQLDSFLDGQQVGENQRAAIVITKNKDGDYMVIRSLINNTNDTNLMKTNGIVRLEDLIGGILNTLK